MIKASPVGILDEEDSLCLFKPLYIIAYVNAFVLLGVNQGLDPFCGKGCPGRELIGETLRPILIPH